MSEQGRPKDYRPKTNHIHSLKRTVKWTALKDMELLIALVPNLV